MSFADTLFQRAVGTGDAQAVKTMLAGGADVNARNENGHTPIIHAIVAGQYHILSLLLSAGANPALRDHTGLSAIDWAERKGRPDVAQSLTSAATNTVPNHPQEQISPPRAVDEKQLPSISAHEKSRRFIAGLRQRQEEKASRNLPNDELQSPPSETEQTNREVTDERRRIFRETAAHEEAIVESEEAIIEPKPAPVPATPERPAPPSVGPHDVSTLPKSSAPTSTSELETHSSHRKRCPQCGATYSSELLAYCVYHEVTLVGADEPIAIPPPENRSALLLVLVSFAIVLGGMVGLFLTRDLFKNETVNTPAPAASSPITQKGIPTLEKDLSGKEVSLPQAEVPADTVKEPTTITVKVRIDRDGRVSAASATEGEQVLRDAVILAARNSTFSVTQLRGRRAEGTINYTFK